MPNGMYGGVRGERKSPLLDYSFVLFFGEALPAEDYFCMVPPVFGRMLHDTGQPAPKERTLRSLP